MPPTSNRLHEDRNNAVEGERDRLLAVFGSPRVIFGTLFKLGKPNMRLPSSVFAPHAIEIGTHFGRVLIETRLSISP